MKKKDKIIGVCAARLENPHPGKYVKALCENAEQYGYDVLIYSIFKQVDYCNAFVKGEVEVFSAIPFDKLSVLVIFTESIANEKIVGKIAKEAGEHDIPVISVDGRIEGCHNIVFGYEDSFEDLARHVVEYHKCKKINFLAGYENNIFSDERIKRYKKVLRENNIPFEKDRLLYGHFWENPAIEACEKWLDMWENGEQERPDAIMCANDIMALIVCITLTNRGIRVPEDIIVTGFDGLELEKYCSPRLTTARDYVSNFGPTIFEIIEKSTSREDFKLQEIRLPFETVFSQSCGCKPIELCNPNEQIMELYRKSGKTRAQSSDAFLMMSMLTDDYSAVGMANKLKQYKDVLGANSMLMFVNREFYENTDVEAENFNKRSMVLLAQIKDGEYSVPLTEIRDGEEWDLMECMLESEHEIVIVPLHQQEEQYGFLVVDYRDSSSDIGAFYDFVLALDQVFGTIKKQSQLHQMYITDVMTKLYNRRGFYGNLKKEMDALCGVEKILFIASVDMDGLKYINDNFGHAEGDHAIKMIAKFIKETIEGRKGICARFGGDEFVVAIISEASQADEEFYDSYGKILERRVERFERRSKKEYKLGVSVGCLYRKIHCTSDIDNLMKETDAIMYKCKAVHHEQGVKVREKKRT